MQKRTKIIATIGPATGSVDMLTKLAEAGLNVCRLNFSHGTHEVHAEYIQHIREVSKKLAQPLTILQDLQGPKIRVANLPPEGRVMKDGERVVFTTDEGDHDRISIDGAHVHESVKPGERVLFDDGLLEVEVEKVEGKNMTMRVIHGGVLLPHKGVNFPNTKLRVSSMTEKDRTDLRFGVEQGVDWIALSFVRSADDLREMRALIHQYEEELKVQVTAPIKIMAKIEKAEAIEHLEEIIKEADGVMVARGDLGVELPMERVPVLQKQIVSACLRAAKPVVVATQMLDSMIRNPRPTRAEVSDIANAVIDHADATMLSGETTTGKYPLEAVEAMTSSIRATEDSAYDDLIVGKISVANSQEEAVTNVAGILARAANAKAIVVASMSGEAVRFVARERPQVPIFAVTVNDRIARQVSLSWGVTSIVLPLYQTMPELIENAVRILLEKQLLEKNTQIIVVAGEPLGESGMVNLVEVRKV